jgi:hypothetical protein
MEQSGLISFISSLASCNLSSLQFTRLVFPLLLALGDCKKGFTFIF